MKAVKQGDIKKNKWYKFKPFPEVLRYNYVHYTKKGKMYLGLGNFNAKEFKNFFVYDKKKSKWKKSKPKYTFKTNPKLAIQVGKKLYTFANRVRVLY